MTDDDYRAIFEAIERTVIGEGPDAEVRRRALEGFHQPKLLEQGDDAIYRQLVMVTFYSGFRAATVTAREHVILGHFPSVAVAAELTETDIARVLEDPAMIRNARKIRACVTNARQMRELAAKHGSFASYVRAACGPDAVGDVPFENVLMLAEDLQSRFEYLGEVTIYHLLTDLGLPVIKPDRVICRVLQRVEILSHESQLLRAILAGRRFSRVTGHSPRYVDRVIVALGQVKTEEFLIERGVCSKTNPQCGKCHVAPRCGYAQRSHAKA